MADWIYDPSSSTLDVWPTFGQLPPGWGSSSPFSQYYDHEAPIVGEASFWAARNLAVTGFHASYGTVTRLCAMMHFWGETSTDYRAMPGLTEGRLRVLVQVRRASGSGQHFCGLSCLNTTGALEETGAGYGFLLTGDQNQSAWEMLRLVYFGGPDGLRSASSTLAQMPYTAPLSSVVALELLWIYDAALDKLTLYGQQGTATDYSDLVPVLSYEQQPALVLDNVTQGVCLGVDIASMTVGDIDLLLDQMVMEGRRVESAAE